MATILVVDDEEQVRVLADSFLRAEGHETLSAATIEQALALTEGDRTIDLLFVDLKIQDDVEGGLKLAKKAAEARPNLKVQAKRNSRNPLSANRPVSAFGPYSGNP